MIADEDSNSFDKSIERVIFISISMGTLAVS
jgi:hypothetical protein